MAGAIWGLLREPSSQPFFIRDPVSAPRLLAPGVGEAQGIFELTHGAPKAAWDLVAPHRVVKLGLEPSSVEFLEREFGPGEGELILDQMTREIAGPGMLWWAGLSGTPSLSVPRESEPASPSPQVCCVALSAKLWPAGGQRRSCPAGRPQQAFEVGAQRLQVECRLGRRGSLEAQEAALYLFRPPWVMVVCGQQLYEGHLVQGC